MRTKYAAPTAISGALGAALDALESQQKADDDQIDLFADFGGSATALPMPDLPAAGAVPAHSEASPAERATLDLLARIDPDALTPREALDALYQLKSVITS